MKEIIDYIETSTEDLIEAEPPAYMSAFVCTLIITGFLMALAHNFGLLSILYP